MPGILPPIAISALVFMVVLASAFTIASAVRRRERRGARRRSHDLELLFVEYLEGRASALVLRRAVRAADDAAYWSALETQATRLARARRRDLSRVLERNRHERSEHRALRDDSPWRRELAARRLSLLRSHGSRRALRKALARGPDVVTLAASLALARDRDPQALRWVLAHPRSFATRRPAARAALLRAFGPGALPTLVDALEQGVDDTGLERAILDTLGASRSRLGVRAIEGRLGHPDLELRVAAARALGRCEASECGSALIAALRDEAWQVRALSAWALGRARVPTAIAPLTARLSDRTWWVRRHSAYALATIGTEGRLALQRVVEASPDPYARDIALEALETASLTTV